MNTRRKDINAHSIQRAVIIGTIGIIALAFGWLALNKNTESRSKAALIDTETVYKAWEFKGTTEGWVGENGTQLKPTANVLLAMFPNNATASLRHDAVKTSLPYDSNKYLKVRLTLNQGDAVLGVTDTRGNTVDEVSNGSSEPGTSESGAGSGVIGDDTFPVCWGPECLSPEEINNAQPIGWPDPNQKCTPCPGGLVDGVCPLEMDPGEGGWCPSSTTLTCTPRPSCLDKPPYCALDMEIPEPSGGWCPSSTTCTPRPPPCTSDPCPLYEPAPPRGGWCPVPTPVPGGTYFDLTIQYQLTGKTTWEKPVVKTGLVSKQGSYAEYAVLLPIGPLSIGRLRLQVSRVSSGGVIQSDVISNEMLAIDRIRLTGPVPTPTRKPTCTPRPSCLDTPPYCRNLIDAPIGGWCPRVTPKPTLLPIVPNKDKPELFNETPRRKGKHWTCKVFPNRSWCQ